MTQTVDAAVTASTGVVNAQAAKRASASLPADADTLAVLELGDNDDSKAFIGAMSRHSVYNVTPSVRQSNTQVPLRMEEKSPFHHKVPPDWWIERLIKQSPNWMYLSGHFSAGALFNQSYYKSQGGAFLLDFDDPTANVLWARYLQGADWHLGDRCHTILIMGCSAINYVHAVRNIQQILTGATGVAPIVLGFVDTCPINGTTPALVKLFVDALASDWNKRGDEVHIAESWLQAGMNWNRYGRGIGFIEKGGSAFKVRLVGSDWGWELID